MKDYLNPFFVDKKFFIYENIYMINNIKDLLEFMFKNKRIAMIITFILVFYGATASPKLPNFVLNLFDNSIFKIFILSLIVFKGNNNPTMSILIAAIFIIVMDSLSKKKIAEQFMNNYKKTNIENFSEDKPQPPWDKKLPNGEEVYRKMWEENGGIDDTCTQNLPRWQWTDPCQPKYIDENDNIIHDSNCKETALSSKIRGEFDNQAKVLCPNLTGDALKQCYKEKQIEKPKAIYEKSVNCDREKWKETHNYTNEQCKMFERRDLILNGGYNIVRKAKKGTCVYNYAPRKFPPHQCKEGGLAGCTNENLKGAADPWWKTVKYCTNDDEEAGTCAFVMK